MLFKIAQYLRYLRSAKTKHGVHSPFVYEFVTKVLPRKPSAHGAQIEAIRRAQSKDKSIVEIQDFGAGYGGTALPLIHKTIAEVIRSSARRQSEGELLSRIIQHYQPQQALELGTNLGYSTTYLCVNSAPHFELVSIEGSKQLSKLAQANLALMGHSPTLIVGEFSEVLQRVIDWSRFHPGFVLLDGNHRKQATLDYFEFLLPRMGPAATIVLDDIYWSQEMTEAWKAIVAHPRVTVSIDIFHLGICFLDREQAKEHFILR